MRSVNVSIGHYNNFMIPGFLNIKIICAYSGADSGDHFFNFLAAENFVKPRFLYIKNLTA